MSWTRSQWRLVIKVDEVSGTVGGLWEGVKVVDKGDVRREESRVTNISGDRIIDNNDFPNEVKFLEKNEVWVAECEMNDGYNQ